MLKSIAWAVGVAGRKSADYLTGIPGQSKGLISEVREAYTAGTQGFKAPAKQPKQDLTHDYLVSKGWVK